MSEPEGHQMVWQHRGLGYPVRLYKTGKDEFAVRYGEQLRTGLTYEQASTELGSSIMHALTCMGHMDAYTEDGDEGT